MDLSFTTLVVDMLTTAGLSLSAMSAKDCGVVEGAFFVATYVELRSYDNARHNGHKRHRQKSQ
jgi:hypothetical protein